MATYSTQYLLYRYFSELDISRFALQNHAAEDDVYRILRAVGSCAANLRRLGKAEEGLIDEAIGMLDAEQVAVDMGTTEQAVRRILRAVQAQLQKQRETVKCTQANGSTGNSINNILNDNPQNQIQGSRAQGNPIDNNNPVIINGPHTQIQRRPIQVNNTYGGGSNGGGLGANVAFNSHFQIPRNPTHVDTPLSQIRILFANQYHYLTTPNPPQIHPSILWPTPADEFAEFIPRTFAYAIDHAKRTGDGHVLLHSRDVDTLQEGLHLLAKRTKEQCKNFRRVAKEYSQVKKDKEKEEKKLKKQQQKASTKDKETVKPSRAKKGSTMVQQSLSLTQPAPKQSQLSGLISDPQSVPVDGQGRLDTLETSPVRPPHIRVGMDGVARPVVYGISASGFNAATTTTAPTATHGLAAPRKNSSLVSNSQPTQTADCNVTDGRQAGWALRPPAQFPRINENITAATDNGQFPESTKTSTDEPNRTAGKHDIRRTPGNSPVAKRTKGMPKPKVKKPASAASLRRDDDEEEEEEEEEEGDSEDNENEGAPVSPPNGSVGDED